MLPSNETTIAILAAMLLLFAIGSFWLVQGIQDQYAAIDLYRTEVREQIKLIRRQRDEIKAMSELIETITKEVDHAN